MRSSTPALLLLLPLAAPWVMASEVPDPASPGVVRRSLADMELSFSATGAALPRPHWDPLATATFWGRELGGAGALDTGDHTLVMAVNGGGYRALFYAEGVTLALDALGILAEVDGWSTVSGGSIFAHDLMDRRRSAPDDPNSGSVIAAVADRWHQDQWVKMDGALALGKNPESVIARKRGYDTDTTIGEMQASLPVFVPNAVRMPDGLRMPLTPAHLADLVRCPSEPKTAPALTGDPTVDLRPDTTGETASKSASETAAATAAARRARRSCIEDAHRAAREVTASLATFASSAVPGAVPNVKWDNGERPMWLADGAWGDRWGLLTAVEMAVHLASRSPRPESAAVFAVDSRPFPGFNHYSWSYSEQRRLALMKRAKFIGLGLELTRTRADEALGQWAFGAAATTLCYGLSYGTETTLTLSPCRPGEDTGSNSTLARAEAQQWTALDQEGMQNVPLRYGGSFAVSHDRADTTHTTSVLRLGADTLLQPALWDKPRQESMACANIAARLYSVVALQPTDTALAAPEWIEEWNVNGLRHLYPFEEPGETAESAKARRAELLMTAGVLTVYLQQQRVFDSLGLTSTERAALDNQARDRLFDVFNSTIQPNFRSVQVAEEWRQCTQLPYVCPSPRKLANGDEVPDNCTLRYYAFDQTAELYRNVHLPDTNLPEVPGYQVTPRAGPPEGAPVPFGAELIPALPTECVRCGNADPPTTIYTKKNQHYAVVENGEVSYQKSRSGGVRAYDLVPTTPAP